MSTRTGRTVVALLVGALLLSGCAGIPREGGVRAGQPDVVDDSPTQVFLPSGPQRDASAEGILRGFIDAASSPEGNYAIAREFLTSDFTSSWDPSAGVTVDDGTGRVITEVDAQNIEVALTPRAEVSARGEFRGLDPLPVSLDYAFRQVDGQWRISAAPNGTVIDETTFNDVFSASALYFFSPGFDALVPDLRWFPRGASAPTKIVNAVLSGPSSWLVGAVATAFPEGTALTADAVQVVGRNAMVDLNTEALNADRITLQRMKAQLTASLPEGMQVEIAIDQNAQNIQDLGVGDLAVNPRVDARALVLRDGAFGFLAASGQTVTPVDGISEAVTSLNPTAVTLASGQRVAVALTADGVYRVRAGNESTLIDSRSGLIDPSIDSAGYSWSVPAKRPNELLVFGSTIESIPVLTPWPEATSIQSLKVSRDGTRLLVVYTIGTEARMAVAGIIRKDGVPVEIGAPLQLTFDIGTPIDAAWIDELTVASLSTLVGGAKQITVQGIGGVRTELESPTDAVSLAGSNSLRDVRVLTAGGGLSVQRGVGWQKRLDGVSLLATQQGLTG
ncbi:hypothetical protein JF66_10415 [Cryobacterium sp. MLB-32]|nr:hypothetical protein JF66_10415 [Cryobacterium sp. MLB-32]